MSASRTHYIERVDYWLTGFGFTGFETHQIDRRPREGSTLAKGQFGGF